MDILTLELFDVTVSEALREVVRAVEERPTLPLRILLGGDRMLRHNVQRLLERLGRPGILSQDGTVWRLEVAGKGAPREAGGQPGPAAPVRPAADPGEAVLGPPPVLVTRSRLGSGDEDMGRRLLVGLLRELDPGVPWVGLALGGLELLQDPQALAVLEQLQARGTGVRISREGQLFALAPSPFEIMEDSQWQRLAGRGRLTIL